MKKSGLQTDLINYVSLGGGNIAGGVLQKGISKIFPQAPAQLLPAIPLIFGHFLSKMKDPNVKFLGYGMISRGFGDGANALGIGEDMISDNLDLSADIEDELADELADEMEAELAAELAAENDGTY